MAVRLVELKVSGIGCASCTLPAKEHFLRVPGVLAVHALGSRVYLILDGAADLTQVLEGSKATEFYFIKMESSREYPSLEDALREIRKSERFTLSTR